MTSKRELLRQQRKWAESVGLTVDSRGYLKSVEANLREPLSATTRAAFEKGSGAELLPRGSSPAKMQALHSSAVLAVNFFDHWVDKDAGPLLEALGISSTLESLTFEAQFPTGLPGNPPNLDVALELASGQVIGVESKFTEWLTPKRTNKPAFKEKYFAGELWSNTGLPRCQALVADIMQGNETFRSLDAPQLVKHALGLATQRRGRFALYYLYFDVPGRASRVHRQDVARFAERVDPVLGFKALTYQALYRALRVRDDVNQDYLAYLRARYVGGDR